MSFFNRLFGSKINPLTEILEQGGTIIDVRTPKEFNRGNVDGSINIPLDQINNKLDQIKKMRTPLVLCCASGVRSANATNILQKNSVLNVYNGGRWLKVRRLMRQIVNGVQPKIQNQLAPVKILNLE